MFQLMQEVEKRICYTTGGICPHREDVVPLCVTEGFCGGKRGPKTGIERRVPAQPQHSPARTHSNWDQLLTKRADTARPGALASCQGLVPSIRVRAPG